MNVIWFKDLDKDDTATVGGKAANLGELASIDLPVPPGFVVTAQAYENFLDENDIADKIYGILDKLNVDNSQELQNASKKIKEIILKAEMPDDLEKDILEAYENLNVNKAFFEKISKQALDIIKAGRECPFVAVRSSATAEDAPEASFAGQQETFLNVKGNSNLLKAVQKCWASLFTARSIYYRVKNNFIHENVLIAVIIQKQIQSQKSGVIFTINPVTNNLDEILIEAVFGLGDAIVQGQVNPDQYLVDKNTLKIKEKRISKKEFMYCLDVNLAQTVRRNLDEEKRKEQVLGEYELTKLAEYSNKIEQHYGKPQDIEYAVENNKIYIVQSRPVTTLKKPYKEEAEEPEKEITEKEVFISGLGASPGIASGPVRIIHNIEELTKMGQGDVLVTRMTSPDYVAGMKKAAAIVTDAGGATCHAAIVSREMGIPCVVGTLKATQVLKDGTVITVDGSKGKVYVGKIEIKEEKKIKYGDAETITEIKVNLDMPDLAEKAAAKNPDGIGLLRCEFMLARHKKHPSYMIKQGEKDTLVNELVEDIVKIAEHFKNKPIWYRTSDMRTDEYQNLEGAEDEPKEDNPMLGWHGIRRSLDDVEFLRAEFEAIKKVHDKGYTNVGIMLSMVSTSNEIRRAKEILKEFDLEPQENIDFGVMIETPASVQIINEICREGIDFISIGSNDLTQFTLAIDRNNAKIQHLFNEMNPAVLRQIQHVIKVCKENNVETSICGQAGSNPEMAEFLVKAGIDSISANIDAIEKIRYIVSKTEKELLLDIARKGFKV